MAGVTRHRVKTPRSRILLIALIAALVAFQAWSTIRAQWAETDAQSQTSAVEQQLDATAEQAKKAADPVLELCATGDDVAQALRDRGACDLAAQVVVEPIPGPEGPAGAPGRGVVSTTIGADGHLRVTYSDGQQVDVGRVVGQDGPKGEPGRGITASNIVSGRLVITYDDGTTQDLGPIVGERGATGAAGPKGEPGRGIVSTENVGGRLVITYDDGVTEDVGPLPAGPEGETGARGPQGAQGVSVQDVRAEQRDGDCVLVFELVDPATNTTSERAVPVPDGVCEANGITIP